MAFPASELMALHWLRERQLFSWGGWNNFFFDNLFLRWYISSRFAIYTRLYSLDSRKAGSLRQGVKK